MTINAPRHPRGCESGFSFLELLLALFIVGALLLPLVGLELQVESQDDRVELQARALSQARLKMEELLAVPYEDLGQGADVLELGGGRRLAMNWRAEVDAPRAGMTTLFVVVRERLQESDGISSMQPVRLTVARREE